MSQGNFESAYCEALHTYVIEEFHKWRERNNFPLATMIVRKLAREGLSFEEIRGIVDCSDATIKCYIKVFNKRGKK